MNIYEKLLIVQEEIKVNKSSVNTFANFKYRTIQDILAEVKPFFSKYKLFVNFTHMKIEGECLYLDLIIMDIENKTEDKSLIMGNKITNYDVLEFNGMIKIDYTKSKMDDSQKVLSAKTFLKKSLLEDILLISEDDDPDSHDNTKTNNYVGSAGSKKTNNGQKPQTEPDKINAEQLKLLFALMNKKGKTETAINKSIKTQYGLDSKKDLNNNQFDKIVKYLEGLPDKDKK
jgi:hypothetical protein